MSMINKSDFPPMRVTVLIFDYVCSVCWGQLIEAEIGGEMKVVCSTYGTLHSGFHRRETAIKGRERSVYDLAEFTANYIDTEFAYDLGLRKRTATMSADEGRQTLERNKRALGRDGGGID